MAKQKKKRTKSYHGRDSKTANAPQVVRVEAVSRSKTGQWWFEKKKIIKPVAIALLVIFVIILLLFELFRAVF